MTGSRKTAISAVNRTRTSSRRRWLRGVSFAGTLAVAGCLDRPPGGDADVIHPGYDTREVRVETSDGEVLGSVTAAIADTPERRYTGLSETESLPEDRGMLFVYDTVGDRTFVMREMSFGIDIVYADADGVVTEIHHAPAPGPDEDGEEQRYPGRGQYVLEVGYRWTADRDVGVGDVLRFGPVEPTAAVAGAGSNV
ncbi:uncharacterized membrane protein (UPF0127 family) [Halorubrum alkaliphilum]|uniref:Uncharacterized membrane protein (UPF0127 family) n=1 Tax=Halorubrum alkaliphilum TaxID=261290 RepID=A0A8T4GCF4_9EURY|nr:DUF192 domain-containing protein [Halorubrum alkaliphilum]MBP1921786.1 uncharacterized membrane protein (UPF0127 family) [Halorubrum alkaliphilum]